MAVQKPLLSNQIKRNTWNVSTRRAIWSYINFFLYIKTVWIHIYWKDYPIKQRGLKTNYYSILKFILHERSPVIASKYFLGVFPKPIVKFNIQTRHIDSSILWAQLLVTILQEANVNRLNHRYASGTFVMSTIFSSCSLLKKKILWRQRKLCQNIYTF